MSKSFTLVKEQAIPELNATVKEYVHKRTGARLLSIINEDENKVFGINFRTKPNDSTGVAHILEHSVLGGSQKYPVKEPFVELLKGSLATFINAFTYPDKTCYPVASQNAQDFYNLIDVYMDAVLHPRISEQTLMQEGWHYEINEAGEPLTYKGVVFNEMKGAYSSPDGVLETRVFESLFPKHVYGLDSGGDPRHIPDLTYETFKAFWENHYHPSNAFIYFYGNDDPEKRLNLMESYLKPYKKKKVRSVIPLAKSFKRPKKVARGYDAGNDPDIEKKHYLTVNWKLPDTSDAALNFSFRILERILIGMPASPLKKALLDSKLGEDLAGLGLETNLRHLVFSTGLKGTRARHAKKIEKLILDTLAALARDGIDPDTVAAAINSLEFALRENNTGAYPRGIALMTRALTTWLYDDDPCKLLAFEAPLDEVKKRYADDKDYFAKLIQIHLIENPHRVTLRLSPDPELGRRLAEEEKARLKEIRDSLEPEQINVLIDETKKLKLRQETPNTEEALKSLPVLKLEDLDRKNKTIPIEIMQLQDTPTYYHDLFTNGIVYLDLGFDLRALPKDLLPYANLFGRALLEMGTDAEDYVKLSQRIGKYTGGIKTFSEAASVHGSKESVVKLFLRAKATASRSADLMGILQDVLMKAKFDNRERLRQIVLEEKSQLEANLIPMGHRYAALRMRAQVNEAGWAREQTNGTTYLFALRELSSAIDKNWKSVLRKLETMREALINRKTMICNATMDAGNWLAFKPQLETLLAGLPIKEAQSAPFDIQFVKEREGLTVPSQVNYVAKGANLYEQGYQFDGSALVAIGYLRMVYIWEKIRVLGGAYGGLVDFDERSGLLTFVSYRDPNLAATIENYDNAAKFLKGLDSSRLNDLELTKAIIGAIGDLDAYQLPDAKGYASMIRHLVGETDEFLQKTRDEVLSTNGEDFIALGEALESFAQSEAIVALGSQSAIEEANVGMKLTKVM